MLEENLNVHLGKNENWEIIILMGKRIAENFVGLFFLKGPCQKYVSCLKTVALSNL